MDLRGTLIKLIEHTSLQQTNNEHIFV